MSCPPFDLRDYYFEEPSRGKGAPADGSAYQGLCELPRKNSSGCAARKPPCWHCRMRRSRSGSVLFPTRCFNLPVPPRAGRLSGLGRAIGFRFGRNAVSRVDLFSLTRPIVRPWRRPPQPASLAAVWRPISPAHARRGGPGRSCQRSPPGPGDGEAVGRIRRRHALETQSMMVRVQEYLDVEKKRLNRLILASNEAAPQEAR